MSHPGIVVRIRTENGLVFMQETSDMIGMRVHAATGTEGVFGSPIYFMTDVPDARRITLEFAAITLPDDYDEVEEG